MGPRVIRPHAVRLLVFAALIVTTGLIEAGFIVALTRGALAATDGVDTVTVTRNVSVSMSVLVGGCVVALMARLGLQYVALRIQSGLQYRVVGRIREQLLGSYLDANWRTQDEQTSGALQQLLTSFPTQIMQMVYLLTAGLAGVLSLVALLGVSLVIDPGASASIVVVLALIIGGLTPLRRRIRARSASSVQMQLQLADRVSEIASIKDEIAALRLSETMKTTIHHEVIEDARRSHRVQLSTGLITPLYTTFAYTAVVLGLWALSAAGTSQVESIGAVIMIMLRSLTYGQQAQQLPVALSQFGPFTDQIDQIQSRLAENRREYGAEVIERFEELLLEGAAFDYANGVTVLADVDLRVPAGEAVGIVGPSGAGKSTLIKLSLGLIRPTRGTVHINTLDVDAIDPSCWQQIAGYVPQEPRIISGTVADNVRFLRQGLSDEAVRTALERAGLDIDSPAFPQGLSTAIGEGRRSLSGGQKQRLVIARALATNPSLLVLDEPTASLDDDAEKVIVETIVKLKGHCALLVITHRDETLKACDRALRLQDGSLTNLSL